MGDSRRAAFDGLYDAGAAQSSIHRVRMATSFLLSFYSRRNVQDLRRAVLFAHDCIDLEVDEIVPPPGQVPRLSRILSLLVDTLRAQSTKRYVYMLQIEF